jgi:hypothetical protein
MRIFDFEKTDGSLKTIEENGRKLFKHLFPYYDIQKMDEKFNCKIIDS